MKDITPILNHYREAVRHLWNTGFLLLDTEQDLWQLQEAFDAIASLLFTPMVLDCLMALDSLEGISQPMSRAEEADPQPLMFLRVVPTGRAPIMINRATPRSGYWDDPVQEVFGSEVDLRFIAYFDFDLVGIRDLEYYHVRIIAFAKHPHLVGRDALLKVGYAQVLWDETVA